MNLSKLKFALVGVIIMGVLSLNFTNPFTVPNEDVKGIANQITLSTTSTQAESAATLTTVIFVTLISSKVISSAPNTASVLLGGAKFRADKLTMNKLD